MSTFEVCWKMHGTATVKAASMDEAIERATNELHDWDGAGVALASVSVDGTDVEA
ncbi:hypothetical protein ACFC25_04160 [Pseudarthrobacter sp. NPDC055928]|uniref:hypothetical protein n=1 Tax=Pseudarthrobacter sp. NPDC055928 TaxID=3345661 RepID=UPI0035D92AC8